MTACNSDTYIRPEVSDLKLPPYDGEKVESFLQKSSKDRTFNGNLTPVI